MKVLVLGGTLFIGPEVLKRLVATGHNVTIFHRGTHEPEGLPEKIKHIHGDRANLAEFVPQFRDEKPEVVLDMRPVSEQDAKDVMAAFKGITRRVVAISSVDVFRAYGRLIGKEPGPPDPTPLTEDSPLREVWYPYRTDPMRADDDPAKWADWYDKIPAERVFQGDPEMPGTVCRLPMVYGSGDYQHRLWPYLKRMDDGRPAILLDEKMATWRDSRGFVTNVAHGIALAVTDDRASGRTYVVAEPSGNAEIDWVRTIADAVGWKGEIVRVPAGKLGDEEGDFNHNLDVDTSRIRRELDYTEIVPLDEALKLTIEWERENPPAKAEPFDYEKEDAILAELRA